MIPYGMWFPIAVWWFRLQTAVSHLLYLPYVKYTTTTLQIQTLNCQIWVDLRRSSGLRRVSGTSLLGCSAMSLMSNTYVTDELDRRADALDIADLWGSCGADEPSCCSIPVLDIRHNCERFPGSCPHHVETKSTSWTYIKMYNWWLIK